MASVAGKDRGHEQNSDMSWEIPDPLCMDISTQLRLLLEQVPAQSPFHHDVEQLLHKNKNLVLPALSQLMLRPSLTLPIERSFRPLLMDLCARWLSDGEGILEKLEALALLIEIHEELYLILHEFASCKLRKGGPLVGIFDEQPVHEVDKTVMHRVLLAYYRILVATPFLPEHLNWDLSLLLNLSTAAQLDRGSRWLAIRCYALQSGMSERKRLNMEEFLLGQLAGEDCDVTYGEDSLGTSKQADGWLLPTLETKRVQDARDELVQACNFTYLNDCSHLTPSDLSPYIANINGILLYRTSPLTPPPSRLVLTKSVVLILRKLAVNQSLRRPTLLSSSPSSGKTTILEHLALQLYPSQWAKIVTIHLADTSLDARALLGSYVSSSSRAVSFEWRDGALIKAMREGKWVLFEDIDRASDDVLSLLLPLIESLASNQPIGARARLSVPSRGIVEAAEGFSIFATRSLDVRGDLPRPTFLGARKWNEIVIPESSNDDLRMIVNLKYPAIAGRLSDALIDLWQTVKDLRTVSSMRTIGIRDLEKFCARTSRLVGGNYSEPSDSDRMDDDFPPRLSSIITNPNAREELYLEARDVFFAAGTTSQLGANQRDAIARVVGEKLGLSEETCEWLLKRRTPVFEVEKDIDNRPVSVRCGRTLLGVNNEGSHLLEFTSHSFKMHKQAMRLVAQLASCIAMKEPVLLSGETGTGKTSVVSYLAALLKKPLTSLNLSTQTESSDLIGGFKPVSAIVPAQELQKQFLDLFQKTFSSKKNEGFQKSLRKAINDAKWKSVVKLWNDASNMALDKLKAAPAEQQDASILEATVPRKRRKVNEGQTRSSEEEWLAFKESVRHFEIQHVIGKGKFAFQYVEGPIVKAIREGAWLLLDEINLASSDTLECISELLQGPEASITLTEKGSLEPVQRHPEFRIFGCMNPATDIGKKDLPANIRAKLTEIEVPPPDNDEEVLLDIVSYYIGHLCNADRSVIADIAQFYTNMKRLSESGRLSDGSGHKPHYSMRTLSRALTFAADTAHYLPLRRALYEGLMMAFAMVLDPLSAKSMTDLINRTILSTVKNVQHFITHAPILSSNLIENSVVLGSFALSCGEHEREENPNYILTPSVQRKLIDLARIISTKRYPILIEGPTSSGKTSAIQYLARRTGHNFVRINNHEHTDIQEYIGSYVSDPVSGKLVFKDGLLVRALRQGDWIVLDELNLAPTDVLEALNRLLDDNRELVIPETGEVVKPHSDFILFATQNPSGVYAGRKALSRALRNRFLEVHFSDVPAAELQEILCQRSRIAPSYSRLIVSVFEELQRRRQTSRIFEGREGFATLRDLFRWADRDAENLEQLAKNGFMLLAERTRLNEDRVVVKSVIEEIMKVKLDADRLYDTSNLPLGLPKSIVWTKSLRRLFVLLHGALSNNEPVLLVGETGTGKTSVCQVYSAYQKQKMRTVNCHQNTEAADIIGGLRPTRPGDLLDSAVVKQALVLLEGSARVAHRDVDNIMTLFDARLSSALADSEREVIETAKNMLRNNSNLLRWHDGPLVSCMHHGEIFLLDEISLADDSVLERLNSVLETSRTLTLAEMGGEKLDESLIEAVQAFKFVATMNPGGDFGKKELSPALRNRFTEIWVPSFMNRDELSEIVENSWIGEELRQLTKPLLDFVEWFLLQVNDTSSLTLRDILTWVEFCNVLRSKYVLPLSLLFIQGGHVAIVDGIPSLSQLSAWSSNSLQSLQHRSNLYLKELSPEGPKEFDEKTLALTETSLHIGMYHMDRDASSGKDTSKTFSFEAPTSLNNTFRLVRACQLSRPILLEGSPGVGKTSLVTALAMACGQKLCRVNLSEQTDLIDLFGSDLPVEGHTSGTFNWNDAEFLDALKKGHWVLLDEMNLASQSILEGLNAVFDHRGTVYIPELDLSFNRHPNFRVFAAQNPLNQGSGRKGLPKSFLNRFTKVFVEALSADDLHLICHNLYPSIPQGALRSMITFNVRLHEDIVVQRKYGSSGAPWEFNLRDLMRWCSLMNQHEVTEPWRFLNTIYRCRFRTGEDREKVTTLFQDVFSDSEIKEKLSVRCITSPSQLSCGSCKLTRGNYSASHSISRLLHAHAGYLETAISAIANNWLLIVNGPESVGKTSFVRTLASLSGHQLEELTLSNTSDTSDLIGSFEQTSPDRQRYAFINALLDLIKESIALASETDFELQSRLLKLRDKLQEDSVPEDKLQMTGYELSDLLIRYESLSSTIRRVTDEHFRHQGSDLQFVWIDGPLVRAMKSGKWLLLDNVNLCSPSVLDRLNPLCEFGGSLTLTENGSTQEIVFPHTDFRLIMIVDTSRGELSRAMRNRGIEVCLDSLDLHKEWETVLSCLRVPPMQENSIEQHSSVVSYFELMRRALLPWAVPALHEAPKRIYSATNDCATSKLIACFSLLESLAETDGRALILMCSGVSSRDFDPFLLRLSQTFPPSIVSAFHYWLSSFIISDLASNLSPRVHDTKVGVFSKVRQPFHDWPFREWISGSAEKLVLERARQLEAYVLGSFMMEYCRFIITQLGITDSVRPIVHAVQLVNAIANLATGIVSIGAGEDQEKNLASILRLVRIADCVFPDRNTVSNFAQQYVAMRLLLDDFDESSPSIQQSLQEYVARAREQYTLTSGLKLTEIWRSMLSVDVDPSYTGSELEEKGSRSESINNKTLSIVYHPDIQVSLDTMDNRCGEAFIKQCTHKTTLLMSLLSIVRSGNERPGHNIVPNIGNTGRLQSLASSYIAWHKAIWDESKSTENSGPIELIKPIFLHSTAKICNTLKDCALNDVQEIIRVLSGNIDLSLQECSEKLNRFDTLLSALLQNIIMVLQAVTTRPEEVACIDNILLVTTSSDSCLRLQSFLSAIREVRHWLPSLNLLGGVILLLEKLLNSQSGREQTHLAGLSWIELSRTVLRLYVPNLAVDPALLGSEFEKIVKSQISWIQSQITAHLAYEVAHSGFDQNIYLRYLSRENDKLTASLNTVQNPIRSVGREADKHEIHLLWDEINSFVKDVVSSERFESLLFDEDNKNEMLSARERVFQDTIANFMQRLGSTYPHYQDLLPAIDLSLFQLKLGLGFVVLSKRTPSSDKQHIIRDILSFPSSRARRALLLADPESTLRHQVSIPTIYLFNISGIAYSRKRLGWNHDLLSKIYKAYGDLVTLWREKYNKEEERKREAETLYRKTNDALKGDEDDSELQLLFPLYEDNNSDEAVVSQPSTEVQSESLTGMDFANDLMSIHLDMFSDKTGQGDDNNLSWNQLQARLVLSLTDAQMDAFPAESDVDTTALRLRILNNHRNVVERGTNTGAYNFYYDPNFKESRRVSLTLKALRDRLFSLASTWPDQLVLQHLRARCDDILSLSNSSPLAKLLGAIEKLLVHMEDWELYASKEYSLSSDRQALIDLVVDWRRLELSGWRLILDTEHTRSLKDLGSWWFRLYDALVIGVVAASADGIDEHLNSYLDSLRPLVEDFIRSSPLGHFDTRLTIIQSFARLTSLYATMDTPGREAIIRTSNILNSMYQFYSLYHAEIQNYILTQRTLIEKDVQDLVRLATWRDVNVYALQQSAHHTHKQLYKRIRKFRVLLQEPSLGRLVSKNVKKLQTGNVVSLGRDDMPGSLPDRNISLEGLISTNGHVLKKFTDIYQEDLASFLDSKDNASILLEELCTSVIVSQEEYQRTQPQPGLSAEVRKRWDAFLLNRKKRSWNDLLKELKRIGLSFNPKPEVLLEQGNRRALMEKPTFRKSLGCEFLADLSGKLDHYYFSCVALLNDLERSIAMHHSDIGTRELQRGVAFFQSALFIASSAKSTIISIVEVFQKITSLTHKLHGAYEAGSCLRGGSAVRASFSAFRVHYCELIGSLEELLSAARTIESLDSSTLVNRSVIEALQQVILQGRSFRIAYDSIEENARSCDLLLLTDDDLSNISSGEVYMQDAMGLLTRIASEEPRISRFCGDIIAWHEENHIVANTLRSRSDNFSETFDSNKMVNALLNVTQGLVMLKEDVLQEDAKNEDDAGHIRRNNICYAKLAATSRINVVLSTLTQALSQLIDQDQNSVKAALGLIIPYLNVYLGFAQNFLASYAKWAKSLFKLTYIHGSLLQSLAEKGFCRLQEDDAEDGAGGQMEERDGTGVGTGTGEQNISDEMQDESQFEGLRGEKDESGGEKPQDDKAVDVDFDLDADLEDGDLQEGEEPGDDDSDQADLDDEFGLNETSNFDEIDEDFWGKEDKEQDRANDGAQDQNGQKSQAQTEMTAMEADEERRDKEKGGDDSVGTESGAEDELNSKVGEEEEPEEGKMNPIDALETKDDVQEPRNKEGDEFDMQSVIEEPMDGEAEPASADDEHAVTEAEAEEALQVSDIEDDMSGKGDPDKEDSTSNQGEEPISCDKADIGSGDHAENLKDNNEGGKDSTGEGSHNAEFRDGTDPDSEERDLNIDSEPAPNSSVKGPQSSDATAIEQSTAKSAEQTGQTTSVPTLNPSRDDKQTSNDPSMEVWRRFDSIQEANAESTDTGNEANGVEFAMEDQESTMQALGPAQAEDHASLNKLNIVEEQVSFDEDAPNRNNEQTDVKPQAGSQAERPSEVEQDMKLDADGDLMDTDEPTVPEEKCDLASDEDQVLDEEVEKELKQWQERGQPEEDIQRIWHLYDTLTQSLAFSLCEQLRLILSPTRATRLMGDFRTGKRLNMKKIIPYIASNYTKDKIWLRRVKPSQREYQVLLAVDDSQSMSNTRSVHLAFQTLSLISKALNRLEVGDLAVASFGASMQLLHGFEDGPFTDQVGAKIVEAFRFQQSVTNVHALLERSIEVLTSARERKSTSSELWQLEIIISDAICQDHDSLRAILQRAKDEHILVVFIVLDAQQENGTHAPHDSIVNLRSVTYQNINGRLQLHDQRYLDTFPFEFYLVLKDVQSLPDVLADTLRQFFECISGF